MLAGPACVADLEGNMTAKSIPVADGKLLTILLLALAALAAASKEKRP
jgi:hypothetical protein